LMCVGHESIEFGALLLRSADTNIDVFAGNNPTAALAIFAKLASLHRWILAVVSRRDPCVYCGTHDFPCRLLPHDARLLVWTCSRRRNKKTAQSTRRSDIWRFHCENF